MGVSPVITIFVRHSEGCKYDNPFEKRCRCPKHLRWSANGKQFRKRTGARSWAEAEDVKRRLEDGLAGRVPDRNNDAKYLQDAIGLFLQDKKVQGVTAGVLGKYTRELDRLWRYCEVRSVFTVHELTRDVLTGLAATWADAYPSSATRYQVRERCRSFLRYCFEAQWLERIPMLPKIKVDESPTMPLTDAEYKRLLDAVYGVVTDKAQCARVHALFQLMRWSGLAIRDALTLERRELQHDEAKSIYRVVTNRQKTGTHVSVPIPANVAQELLEVPNGNETYVFWSGEGEEESICKNWMKYYVAPAFKAAKIASSGHMMSHRLRDTFAVGLLTRGVPMEEVSKSLGHESIRTTEKSYSKWVKGRQDRLDALVTGTWAAVKR